MTEEWIH